MRLLSSCLVVLVITSIPAIGGETGRLGFARVPDVDGDGVAELAVVVSDSLDYSESGGRQIAGQLPGRRKGVLLVSGRTGNTLAWIDAPEAASGFGRALVSARPELPGSLPTLVVGSDTSLWFYQIADKASLRIRVQVPVDAGSLKGPLALGDFDGDGVGDALAVFAPAKNEMCAALAFSGLDGRVLACIGRVHVVPSDQQSAAPLFYLTDARVCSAVAALPDEDGDQRSEIVVVFRKPVAVDVLAPLVQEVHVVVLGDKLRELRSFTCVEKMDSDVRVVADLGDIDGDEKGDILVTYGYGCVTAISSRGHRTWKYGVGGVAFGLGTSAEVVDVTGDSAPDVVLFDNEKDSRTFGLGGGRGRIHVLSAASGVCLRVHYERALDVDPRGDVEDCLTGVEGVSIGDVDGDGLTDIALFYPRLGRIGVRSGSGFGLLWSRPLIAPSQAEGEQPEYSK